MEAKNKHPTLSFLPKHWLHAFDPPRLNRTHSLAVKFVKCVSPPCVCVVLAVGPAAVRLGSALRGEPLLMPAFTPFAQQLVLANVSVVQM